MGSTERENCRGAPERSKQSVSAGEAKKPFVFLALRKYAVLQSQNFITFAIWKY